MHLDFKGACSYILTRDFVDNNFTVIANFGKFDKDTKILSVLFHAGSEKLEMFHDYQVRLFLIEFCFKSWTHAYKLWKPREL